MSYKVIVRTADAEGKYRFDGHSFKSLDFAERFAAAGNDDFVIEDCVKGGILKYRLGPYEYTA